MQVVNVMDSPGGAVGDGITDDTAAIQGKINAVDSGGVVYFPPTSAFYKTTSSLVISKPVTLRGEGVASFVKGDPGNAPLIVADNVGNVKMQDLQLANIHSVAGDALCQTVRLTRANDCLMSNIKLSAGRVGVSIQQGLGVSIVDCVFDGVLGGAVSSGAYNGTGTGSSRIKVLRNTILNGGSIGVAGPPHDLNFEDTDSSLIEGNTVDHAGFTESGASAIQIFANHNSKVSGVIARNNTMRRSVSGVHPAIMVGGMLDNCRIEDNDAEGFVNGFIASGLIDQALFDFMLRGNRFRKCTSAALVLSASGAAPVELPGCIIAHNLLTESGLSDGLGGMRIRFITNAAFNGNTIERNTGHGATFIGSSHNLLTSNKFRNNSQGAPGKAGLVITHEGSIYSNFNSVVGSDCSDSQSTPTQACGIYVVSGTANRLLSNAVYGNTGVGYSGKQIYDSGTGTIIS